MSSSTSSTSPHTKQEESYTKEKSTRIKRIFQIFVKTGAGSAGQFYAFYFYAGWLETRDLGAHWYPITRGTLSGMQTPSLLTDSNNPNHLYLGGDQGLFESHDDGNHWLHISAIEGNVQSIIAANTTPHILYCA